MQRDDSPEHKHRRPSARVAVSRLADPVQRRQGPREVTGQCLHRHRGGTLPVQAVLHEANPTPFRTESSRVTQ